MRGVSLVGAVLWMVATVAGAEPVLVGGTVVGADGKPVAGARVLLQRYTRDAGWGLVETWTGENGGFKLWTERYVPESEGQRPRPLLALVTHAGLAAALRTVEGDAPLTIVLGDRPEARAGVVQGPNGQPVANAEVLVTSLQQGGDASGPERTLSFGYALRRVALSDEAGRFSFSDLSPALVLNTEVTAPGFAPVTVALTSSAPAAIALQPEAHLSGRVTRDGQPLVRAEVSLRSAGSAAAPGFRGAWARTGEDGTFVFNRLPAGTVDLEVRAPELPEATYARVPARRLTLKPGEQLTDVNTNFSPGALIRGRVLDTQTEAPVPGAGVWATVPQETEGRAVAWATADANGAYQIRLQPGTYTLQARAPGGVSAAPASGQPLALTEGQTLDGQDLKVKRPRQIAVTVLLPDGQPAANAQVRCYGLQGSTRQSRTGADGRCDLFVAEGAATPAPPAAEVPAGPGQALVVARLPEKNLAATVQDPLRGNALTLQLQPAGTLAFSVHDPQNQPLRGVRFEVRMQYGRGTYMDSLTATSDAAGQVRVTGLPPAVKLLVSPDWSWERLIVKAALTDERNPYVLKPGEELALPDVVVDPQGRTVRVRVQDAQGQPARGYAVLTYYSESPATTNEQGQAEITRLPLRGDVGVLVGYATQGLFAAALAKADSPLPLDLQPRPLGQATGLLIAREGGKPLAGWKVTLRPAVGQWLDYRLSQLTGQPAPREERTVLTDEQGRWSWDGLVAGAGYQVCVKRQVAGQPFEGGWPVGEFVATGGKDVQDLGIMQVTGPGVE